MTTIIELTAQDGSRLGQASAEIIGSLGVHCGVATFCDEWIVTHVPTGGAVAHCRNEVVARAMAQWLEQQVPADKRADWQSSNLENARRVFGDPCKMRIATAAKMRELSTRKAVRR